MATWARPWSGRVRGRVPDRAMGEEALAELLPHAARPALMALSAGLLLASDRWEAGHEAAQRADDLGESPHSAYWHAIAHRREPDPGNAAYWLRRVGRHPAFHAIAEAASPILAAWGEPGLADRLIRDGAWDPSAFFSYCGRARPGTPQEALAATPATRRDGRLAGRDLRVVRRDVIPHRVTIGAERTQFRGRARAKRTQFRGTTGAERTQSGPERGAGQPNREGNAPNEPNRIPEPRRETNPISSQRNCPGSRSRPSLMSPERSGRAESDRPGS